MTISLTASPRHIPEIDGLRAIAILLVLGYHAYPTFVPGGFIGVDVFFVISGFVISRTYLLPLIRCERTLQDFFVRRLRRLVPAMLPVLAVSSLAGVVILYPHHLVAYAYSLLAQPLYLQNFVFWYEGDYFEGALTKPLLHTWSLAVEEQFYVLLALAILFFRRFPRTVVVAVVFICVASLLVGLAFEVRSPKTVFFMLPTRAWQFALGIAAFLITLRLARLDWKGLPGLTTMMIVAIVACGFAFDERSPFPGPQAIIASMATAGALVIFAVARPNVGYFLTSHPLRYVGEISYGLYLWHWPPLAYFSIVAMRPADFGEATLLMLFAFVAASISYHVVENPIRRGAHLKSSRRIMTLSGAGTLSILLVVSTFIGTHGLIDRYSPELQALFRAPMERGIFRCGKIFVLLNRNAEMCPLTDGTPPSDAVLLLGDSHADVLKEVFAEVGRETGRSVYLTTRNCDLGTFGQTPFCGVDVLEKIVEEAKVRGVTEIVAISYWQVDRLEVDRLRSDVDNLGRAGVAVSLMETVPNHPSYDPIERVKQALKIGYLNLSGITLRDYEESLSELRTLFSSAQLGSRATVVSPASYLCNERFCHYWAEGVPLYSDSHHLTYSGALQLRPLVKRLLD